MLVILMHESTRRPELTHRASPREAAPTAAQWARCCLAMMAGAAGVQSAAWQVALYTVAREQAERSVRAAELRACQAQWN
jgi:hypothetical protein